MLVDRRAVTNSGSIGSVSRWQTEQLNHVRQLSHSREGDGTQGLWGSELLHWDDCVVHRLRLPARV